MTEEINCEQCSKTYQADADSPLSVCPSCGHLPTSPGSGPAMDADATMIAGAGASQFDPESALSDPDDAEDLPDFAAFSDAPTLDSENDDIPDFSTEEDAPAFDPDGATQFVPGHSSEASSVEPTIHNNPRSAPTQMDPTVDIKQGNHVPPVAPRAKAPAPAPARPVTPPPTAIHQASGAPQKYDDEAGGGISKGMFIAVVSYASAVTLVLIYLLFNPGGDPHQLESLPDLQPLSDEAFQIIPVDAAMAPGHRMQLGDGGTRFGNVLVRPLKVTRGPVEFEYFMDGKDVPTRDPSAPVLKLWVEFRNESKNQVFAPVDSHLLAKDHVREKDFRRFSNNFLRAADGGTDEESLVFTLNHSPDDPFNLKGQNLGQALKPGESCTVFIPSSEEGIEELDGDLIWRMQFRKGFHPKSMHGVTTLIEIEFDASDIEEDSAGDDADAEQQA